MATFTFYPAESGCIRAYSEVSYINARTYGTVCYTTLANNTWTGQIVFEGWNWETWETFLGFDTSTITAPWNITGSAFSLYLAYIDPPAQAVSTMEMRSYDYGTLALADFIPCANLGNYTLRATLAVVQYMTEGAKSLTDVALSAAVNKAGMTRFVLASSRSRLGQSPVATYETANWATTASVFTVYADAPPVPPRIRSGNRIW